MVLHTIAILNQHNIHILQNGSEKRGRNSGPVEIKESSIAQLFSRVQSNKWGNLWKSEIRETDVPARFCEIFVSILLYKTGQGSYSSTCQPIFQCTQMEFVFIHEL